ncbi:MAG: hypothetical protein ACM3KR_10975, partial [Deltaproteobacteria bacterium]
VYNIGYTLANYTDLSVLIFDFNYLFGEMEFLVDRKTSNCIDDLISIVRNRELTPELLVENTEVLRPNLRLVNPSRIDNSDYLKENTDEVLKIIEVARKAFDIIIVDTTAGTQSALSRLIYSNCDIFLNVMTQNPYILEWYKAYNQHKDIKEINVINMFEESIYPNSSEIKKAYGIEHMSVVYSCGMRDFYNQKKTNEFVKQKNKYNLCIQNLIKRVASLMNIDIALNIEEGNKSNALSQNGFLKRLFNKS